MGRGSRLGLIRVGVVGRGGVTCRVRVRLSRLVRLVWIVGRRFTGPTLLRLRRFVGRLRVLLMVPLRWMVRLLTRLRIRRLSLLRVDGREVVLRVVLLL